MSGQDSILRYPAGSKVPPWISSSHFFSVAQTDDELSIVCETECIRDGYEKRDDGWKCLKVEGPLDLSLTGVLSSIAKPLAEAEISIFAISTFDTDYVMVRDECLKAAKEMLAKAGFDVN